MGQAASNFGNKVAGGLSTVGKGIVSGVTTVGKSVYHGVKTVAKAVVQPVASAVSGALDYVGLKEPLKKVAGFVADGIKGAGNLALQGAQGLGTAIGGKSFGRGFRQGIESGWNLTAPFNPVAGAIKVGQSAMRGVAGRQSITDSFLDVGLTLSGAKALKMGGKIGKAAKRAHRASQAVGVGQAGAQAAKDFKRVARTRSRSGRSATLPPSRARSAAQLVRPHYAPANYGFAMPPPTGNVSVQSGRTVVPPPPTQANAFPFRSTTAGQRPQRKPPQRAGLAVESGRHPRNVMEHMRFGFTSIPVR
jgi:hypothetical protein